MAIFKCKMCGGDLDVSEEIKVCECEYCGTKQTVPTADNEKKINLFNRANRLRFANEFDKAAGIYESIIAEFPEESEAYWGLCLCKYGIEYVDDPANAKKIPTCHRTSFEGIFDDSNFNLALEYADMEGLRLYREEAKEIDRLQKSILEIAQNEEPFDVFICYKETDEIGQRTKDSVLAQDIYDALTDKGYKVFFSRITLEDKLGQEFEPYIFAALNSAKVMLAIGTKYEYYNAVWVKNEWSRFLDLMKADREKTLIPCYCDIDAYDMPSEFKNLQGQDMSKIGFIQDLSRGIDKIIQKKKQVSATSVAPTGALTKRGYIFLGDKDFEKADSYFDKALDENPEDSQAYVGKFLATLRKVSLEEIEDMAIDLEQFNDFNHALQFAVGSYKDVLTSVKNSANKKYLISKMITILSSWAKQRKIEERKLAKQKETEELLEKIKELSVTATIEGYEKIAAIYEDACERGLNSNIFSEKNKKAARRRVEIFKVLAADCEKYTLQDIMESNYFKTHRIINTSDILEDLSNMIKKGDVERIREQEKFVYYRLKESLENMEIISQCKYEKAISLFHKAKKEKGYAHYFEAANIFKSLGDFQNSKEMYCECKTIGENQKREFDTENARKEEEQCRKEEQRRKEEQARQEQLRKEEQRKFSFRQNGVCQYCGGEFKGLFTKKCVSCSRVKDY